MEKERLYRENRLLIEHFQRRWFAVFALFHGVKVIRKEYEAGLREKQRQLTLENQATKIKRFFRLSVKKQYGTIENFQKTRFPKALNLVACHLRLKVKKIAGHAIVSFLKNVKPFFIVQSKCREVREIITKLQRNRRRQLIDNKARLNLLIDMWESQVKILVDDLHSHSKNGKLSKKQLHTYKIYLALSRPEIRDNLMKNYLDEKLREYVIRVRDFQKKLNKNVDKYRAMRFISIFSSAPKIEEKEPEEAKDSVLEVPSLTQQAGAKLNVTGMSRRAKKGANQANEKRTGAKKGAQTAEKNAMKGTNSKGGRTSGNNAQQLKKGSKLEPPRFNFESSKDLKRSDLTPNSSNDGQNNEEPMDLKKPELDYIPSDAYIISLIQEQVQLLRLSLIHI
eukprot:TRINITY_DN17572_c0_g1_i1.p1 TRINITY_DN17572_c0_g1~~TRINITY_DN17572_c0_g1_i1.p1  ORF type:complete len:394 (-),score=84.33 TRINITY_DN17572_c0_g1_i1:60-1241(-)